MGGLAHPHAPGWLTFLSPGCSGIDWLLTVVVVTMTNVLICCQNLIESDILWFALIYSDKIWYPLNISKHSPSLTPRNSCHSPPRLVSLFAQANLHLSLQDQLDETQGTWQFIGVPPRGCDWKWSIPTWFCWNLVSKWANRMHLLRFLIVLIVQKLRFSSTVLETSNDWNAIVGQIQVFVKETVLSPRWLNMFHHQLRVLV